MGPLISTPMNVALTQAMTPVAGAFGGAAAAAPAAAAAMGAAGGGFAGLGGLAGLGQAASVGPLSVPQILGLGRDTAGGDDGRRAVGVGVAGRQSGRGGWATNGSWATNDGRDGAGRGDGRRSGRGRCSCFQILAAPQRALALAGRRILKGSGIRVASSGVSSARRIPVERTRAPRLHAGHRVRTDQRTCATHQMMKEGDSFRLGHRDLEFSNEHE